MIVSTYQICGQHLSPTKYGIRPDFIEYGGWPGFAEKIIQPDIDWGCKRVMLHLPFACGTGSYQFDQYITAKNAKLLTTIDFVPVMRKLREQGVEVIVYIGTQKFDPDFAKRKIKYRVDEYLGRVFESVKVILDAGSSIAFDWANDDDIGSVEYEVLDAIRALCRAGGSNAYIEPVGHKDFPHTHSWSSITQEKWFRTHDWWATNPTGEVILWVDDGPAAWTPDLLADRFKVILSERRTPAGIVKFLREGGYQLSDFQEIK